jgi:short-subunit dehydrogenase
MKDLRGKNAIITGASRGLGVYIAKTLAEHGVNVVLAARSVDKLENTRAICEAMGVKAIAVPADVASLDDLCRLVATAERELGSVDILVNNAGIEIVSTFAELSLEQIDEVTRTNYSSALWLTKLVLPSMLARRDGAIVNVASMAGKSPVPFNTIYCGSKAGMINFANALNAELEGTGVHAGSVCPGFVADAGMWADHEAGGATMPRTLGTISPQKVADGVIKVIKGQPEVIVASGPMRPLLALGELWPSLRFRVIRRLGLNKMMGEEAARLKLGEDRAASANVEKTPAGHR